MSLCSKTCPGCGHHKSIGDFLGIYGHGESVYCYDCLSYKVTSPRGKYKGDSKNIKKENKEYYEIKIKEIDDLIEDSLISGEKWVTWDRLYRKNPKKDKKKKRKIVKKRKTKLPPWYSKKEPSSEKEKRLRKQYEHLWYMARDEELPLKLVECNSWDAFWKEVSSQLD